MSAREPRLGTKNAENLKSHIESIFERNSEQQDVLIELYRMVSPYELIKSYNGYPVCGEDLWHFIASHFKSFNRQHHPSSLTDFFWDRDGWNMADNLGPWEISFRECRVIYHTPKSLRKERHRELRRQAVGKEVTDRRKKRKHGRSKTT